MSMFFIENATHEPFVNHRIKRAPIDISRGDRINNVITAENTNKLYVMKNRGLSKNGGGLISAPQIPAGFQ
jgi:hypothetical protein